MKRTKKAFGGSEGHFHANENPSPLIGSRRIDMIWLRGLLWGRWRRRLRRRRIDVNILRRGRRIWLRIWPRGHHGWFLIAIIDRPIKLLVWRILRRFVDVGLPISTTRRDDESCGSGDETHSDSRKT
jgi:hypothetical protein